ncbi:MAG: DMT family transporter [Synechococcales cyanobacterium K32_A2020_035]|nr:DMT family transporter [Synechococcales cyanobacterium K32_A2020_035]
MSFLSLFRSRSLWARCQICLYLALSLLGGALLPIQASMNAQLARSLTSAPMAANVSYLVGFLALAALLLTHRFEQPDWLALPKAPHWSLTGGIFGAWYIASSAYFISTLGATLTLGFVVFGQAIAGLIADHFGWLGLPQHRLTPYRRVAIGLFIVALFFLIQ